MELIGEKIKHIRSSHNLSQSRFGKRIGVTGKAISAYETGRSEPPLFMIKRMANEYDVSFLQLNEDRKNDLELKLKQIKISLSEIEEILVKT